MSAGASHILLAIPNSRLMFGLPTEEEKTLSKNGANISIYLIFSTLLSEPTKTATSETKKLPSFVSKKKINWLIHFLRF